MAVLARLILSVLLWGQFCQGLYVSDMYPFGEAYSDTKLSTEYDEDISSAEIKLGTNVKFFSREYKSIFVSIFFTIFPRQIIFTKNIVKFEKLIFPSNPNFVTKEISREK